MLKRGSFCELTVGVVTPDNMAGKMLNNVTSGGQVVTDEASASGKLSTYEVTAGGKVSTGEVTAGAKIRTDEATACVEVTR